MSDKLTSGMKKLVCHSTKLGIAQRKIISDKKQKKMFSIRVDPEQALQARSV